MWSKRDDTHLSRGNDGLVEICERGSNDVVIGLENLITFDLVQFCDVFDCLLCL